MRLIVAQPTAAEASSVHPGHADSTFNAPFRAKAIARKGSCVEPGRTYPGASAGKPAHQAQVNPPESPRPPPTPRLESPACSLGKKLARTHPFRRVLARQNPLTWLAGVDPVTRREILGHAHEEIEDAVYGDPTGIAERREALEKVRIPL